jgi:hypothetical protein
MTKSKMLLNKLSQLYAKQSIRISMTSKSKEEKRSIRKLLKIYKLGIEYKRKNIKELHNQNATEEAITKSLHEQLEKTGQKNP